MFPMDKIASLVDEPEYRYFVNDRVVIGGDGIPIARTAATHVAATEYVKGWMTAHHEQPISPIRILYVM